MEKPAPKDAPSNLSIIGRYVLLPEVVRYLAQMERGAGNEVQLTDAMAKMIGKRAVPRPASSRAGASIAATRSAFSRRRSPSRWRGRTSATRSARF